jgi:hypothetical protein
MKREFLIVLSVLFTMFTYARLNQNSVNLDGKNDYIQTKCAGITGMGARTVEAWINTTANADPGNGGVQKNHRRSW